MRPFNEDGIRTASNWSPNQMWLNGMLNKENPLTQNSQDETPDRRHETVHQHLETSLQLMPLATLTCNCTS